MNWSLLFQDGYTQFPLPPCSIQIVPTNWNWNDFSYNYNALVTITPPDNRKRLSLPAYVTPLVGDSTNRLRDWILKNQNIYNKFVPSPKAVTWEGTLAFATLFTSDQSYSDIAKWVNSTEEKISILRSINDIVLLNRSEYRSDVEELLIRPSFMYGVLRSPSAYRSLRRGYRSLQGLSINTLEETRSNFVFKTELHGFNGSVHELKVEFKDSELFEDRIHALIGINGAGKTRLLRELVLTLGQRFTANTDEAPVFSELSEAISQNYYQGLNYNRLLVFSTAGEDRFPNRSSNDGQYEYQYFNLSYVGDARSDLHEGNPLTRLMVDVLRDGTKFSEGPSGASLTRFGLLKRTLKEHVDLELLFLPIPSGVPGVETDGWVYKDSQGHSYVRAFDVLRMNEQRQLLYTSLVQTNTPLKFFVPANEGNQVRPVYLSSGQSIFFRFALNLISSIDNGTLVIIDEPETHLHPNLICEFVTLLYTVLNPTKSIALIATHSAYVVREVPTHCAHIFSLDQESKFVDIGHVRMKTLGANVDSISQAVFGDATARKYHEKLAAEIAEKKLDQTELLARYGAILSPELLIVVREMLASREEGN